MERGKISKMFLINNTLKYNRNGTGLESASLKFRIKSYFMHLLT